MGKKSGRITLLTSLATMSALCLAATTVWAQSITVGTVNGAPGDTVSFDVTIQVPAAVATPGVAGTQNDVTFDPANTPVGTVCLLDTTITCTTDQDCITASGDPTDKCNQPACTPNTAIKKESTAFSFQPPGCSGAACTGVRALVFSQTAAQANKAIPDGSKLYSCSVKISPTASGTFPLTTSNVVMSKPANSGCGSQCQIAGATGVNGSVTAGGAPPATNTPGGTPPEATATPTTGVATATPTTGVATATPTTGGATATPTTGGATATPTTKATGTATTGVATATPGVVKLASDLSASATSLTVNDASSLPSSGTVLIDSELINYSGKSGNTLTGLTRGANGTTAAAHTANTKVTSVPTGGGINTEDSDGCQIGTAGGGAAWLLLIPAIGLLAVRRRSR